MNILWINPCFLDYRVPVYRELDILCGGNLSIIFSEKRVPARVIKKIKSGLNDRAIALNGEKFLKLGDDTGYESGFSNRGILIPYQPGLAKTVLRQKCDVVIAEGFFQWTPVALIKKIFQQVPLVLSYERTFHTERNCSSGFDRGDFPPFVKVDLRSSAHAPLPRTHVSADLKSLVEIFESV